MKLSFITSLFKKKNDVLRVPDTILVKKLKSLSSHSNLLVYSNVKIYHHTHIYDMPLIMLDPLRGLYIFEIKDWSYDDLKNANVQKAQNQEASANTLSFDNTHTIIRKKFNELTHNDGVPIFNYLIMENLSADQYEHLNDSLKDVLPFQKLIFNDYKDSDIFKKLQDASPENDTLPSANQILGTLFIQYTIIDEQNALHLCTPQQQEFLDSTLESFTILNGTHASGKSTLLLLKAVIELLENSSLKIIIIKPTILACDLFKKRLLEITERAIIEIDLTSIEILTPLELLNRHLEKLSKKPLENIADMDLQQLNKKIRFADILMCDDSHLLAEPFVAYLKTVQKASKLLIVNEKHSLQQNSLTEDFRKEKRQVQFLQTNPHAKAMQLISTLLTTNKDETILVVSNILTQEKLKDDLESYILQTPEQIDSSKHLINQHFSQLLFATYLDINALSAKHIIMLDLCFTNANELEYAFNLASESVNILYEDDCQEVTNLKDMYESNQERARVERETLS